MNPAHQNAHAPQPWRRTCVGLLLVGIFLLVAAPAQADEDFSSRFTANQPGDITLVGNTVLTCPVGSPPNQTCINAQKGSASNNNSWTMARVDVDGNPATTSSSRATLTVPPGGTVLFAGLYWFGNTASATRNTVKFHFVSAPGARFRRGKACWTFDRVPKGAVKRLRLVTRAARLPTARRVRNVARARAAGVRSTAARAVVRVQAAPGRSGGVTG